MSAEQKLTILAVDDDSINLAILIKEAREGGYNVKEFEDMECAWNYLNKHPDNVDIALLDKMMPGMNGIDMLRQIKADERLKHIPVILQTGDVGLEQMQEALNEGAHYYLTKPFHPGVLNAIIHSAAQECHLYEELKKKVQQNRVTWGLLNKGNFRFRTRSEAKRICTALADMSESPELVTEGLIELLYNAIEHGNLEIGYEQKRACLTEGTWEQELWNRLNENTYRSRYVELGFERQGNVLNLVVADQGAGFDWEKYMSMDPSALSPDAVNGRGILRARSSVLRDVRFHSTGNQVSCSIDLKAK